MVKALLEGRKTQTRRLSWHKSNGGVDKLFPWPTVWQQVKPGDILWVRESWSFDDAGEFPDGRPCIHVEYLADHERAWLVPDKMPKSMRTFPSIHMPRSLSRITLKVADVRLQKLRQINDEDAEAEGFTCADQFLDYWFELHPIKGECCQGDAQDDPEIVALTFKVHRQNIDDFVSEVP
jgi:hypothetical protein